MNTESMKSKGQTALKSARVLLEAGDPDGASNCAYYAMFDTVRAALIEIGAPASAQAAKTHSGSIAAFNLYLVKTNLLPRELGRALSRAQEIRILADCKRDGVPPEDAANLINDAESFIATIIDNLL